MKSMALFIIAIVAMTLFVAPAAARGVARKTGHHKKDEPNGDQIVWDKLKALMDKPADQIGQGQGFDGLSGETVHKIIEESQLYQRLKQEFDPVRK